MKSTELMIGNCVQDEHGITQYVYRIWNGGAELVETINGDDDLDYPEDEIFPIPLTEEWLVKFGFIEVKRHTHDFEEVFYGKSIIKNSPNHFEQLVISLPLGYAEIGEFNIEESYLMNIEISKVHQLQNLYFALTNEELTFKTK